MKNLQDPVIMSHISANQVESTQNQFHNQCSKVGKLFC